MVDEDSTLVFAIEAFYKYFVLHEKMAVNKKITDILPVKVADELYEKHLQVLETGEASESVKK